MHALISMRNAVCSALAASLLAVAGSAGAAPVLGQLDDFASAGNGVMSWNGPNANPTFIATGGAGGAADGYLRIQSFGLKAATYNQATRWTGDFQSAGVDAVAVDFMSPVGNAVTPLSMRAVIMSNFGGERWTSSTAFLLPNDGAWHHVVFSLRQSDLVQVLGVNDYASTMMYADRIMFRHDVDPASSDGTSVGTNTVPVTVGIDNVSATTVPEPGGLALLALGVVGLARRRRPS